MNKYVLFTVLVVAYFTAVSGATCPSGNTSFANCSACNVSTANAATCISCNSGFGFYNTTVDASVSFCGPCDVSCANCTLAANATQCVASNDLTLANATAPQICAVINTTSRYQTYLPGVFVNNASNSNNTYSCYACPVNCTNCSSFGNNSLANGSRALSAVLNCTTCQTNTSFVNTSTSNYGCFVSTTTTGTTTTGTTTTTTGTTLAATASCSTTDTSGNCLTCPVSYAPLTASGKTICAVCSPACLNCRAPADSTQCVNSNITAYNNASASTPCGNYSYPTQTYLAGAANSTTFTYTCYACPYNCTDCTLTNGSKPTAAITNACKTCVNGTSLQTVTVNGTTATGCFYTSSSIINAGLTIGAVMTVLVSLLL